MWERRANDGAVHGITGRVEFATDLFERATVEQLARRLKRILVAVAADAGQPIGEIEILDEQERRQLLLGWNDTARSVAGIAVPELLAP